MYGRYAFSIVIGVVVTMSLLFLMQVLIATGKQALTKPRDRAKLEFVRVKRNEALNTEDFTPEKPPKPPETPPETPPQDMDNIDPTAPTINVAPPSVAAETSIGGPGGMNIAEGDYLPIVRVAPVYPARALSRGLEGYVDMSFTVTTTGTVKDPLVMFSTSSLFERAAIRAVLKFKYKPRVVDGVPVEVPNVKTRISFQIEE
ncbi:MAG: energy transducer TonB [Gammaproteobacteria bacterium]|jgi:protein TonB|nr:energy transducer TonB [Gammaproteobacteria bacterium]MDH3758605.1 energy transducer TonB [Gammaproteobacteria bacterium]MDH3848449.1 energy transducer TonB [Gammaproteobacteria bacterium]MDH3863390.1 energy transducer TonB [Gammaproteobacteria bacterium]MDH3905737.1 energy transducer TonB [Gammaproteobacteria bacterium]